VFTTTSSVVWCGFYLVVINRCNRGIIHWPWYTYQEIVGVILSSAFEHYFIIESFLKTIKKNWNYNIPSKSECISMHIGGWLKVFITILLLLSDEFTKYVIGRYIVGLNRLIRHMRNTRIVYTNIYVFIMSQSTTWSGITQFSVYIFKNKSRIKILT